MNSDTPIDIAICTRNRLLSLKETLAALQEAVRGYSSLRILVVDNGSVDGTGAYLAGLAATDPRIIPLSEPQPGLYHARAAVIRMSRGDILIFVDDDVVPAPDFLEKLLTAFSDPSVGVAGPSIEGLFEGPLPPWFPPRLLGNIPVLPIQGPIQECGYPSYPPGACLAIRQAPCLMHYLSPTRRRVELGPGGGGLSGQSTVDGDDTDLCEIYARAGFRIIRVPDAKVGHRVHTSRLTPSWIIGKFDRDGRLRVRLARLRGKPGLCRETLLMLAALPVLAPLAFLAEWLEMRGMGMREPDMGRGILIRAYFAKSLGAWREILLGERDLRFSYPPDSPSY